MKFNIALLHLATAALAISPAPAEARPGAAAGAVKREFAAPLEERLLNLGGTTSKATTAAAAVTTTAAAPVLPTTTATSRSTTAAVVPTTSAAAPVTTATVSLSSLSDCLKPVTEKKHSFRCTEPRSDCRQRSSLQPVAWTHPLPSARYYHCCSCAHHVEAPNHGCSCSHYVCCCSYHVSCGTCHYFCRSSRCTGESNLECTDICCSCR